MTIPATTSASSPTTGPVLARRRMPRKRSTTHAAPETERSHNGLPMALWAGTARSSSSSTASRSSMSTRAARHWSILALRNVWPVIHGTATHCSARLIAHSASPALRCSSRAALATSQAGRTSYLRVVDEERRDTLEAALRATDGTETPERALLLATLVELTTADPERARALSDDALVIARRVDDDFTLWQVLHRRAFAIWAPATLDERTANAYELREVAERLGDRRFRLGTARNLLLAAACRGDLAESGPEPRRDDPTCGRDRSGSKLVGRPPWDWRGDDCSLGTSTKPNRLRAKRSMIASQAEELERVPSLWASALRDSSRPRTPRRDDRAARTVSVSESRGGPLSRGSPRRAVLSRPTRGRSSGLRAACRQPLHRLPRR